MIQLCRGWQRFTILTCTNSCVNQAQPKQGRTNGTRYVSMFVYIHMHIYTYLWLYLYFCFLFMHIYIYKHVLGGSGDLVSKVISTL